MEVNTTSILSQSSMPSSPEDPDASPSPHAFPTNAPSVSQLAENRAYDLDYISHFKFSRTDICYSTDSEFEKRQDDSRLPSANTSDVFIPASQLATLEPSPPPSMSRLREFAFIFITCIAQFLSLCALNQTVAPVMVLANYFHIEDYGTLSWFSAAFSMSVGTFILPAGM